MENDRQTPLWNNELPIEERLDYLIKELTLEEKIACLTTGCPDVARLGITAFSMGGEAAHGIEARHDQAFNAGEAEPTTCFTQPIGMSASFDRELIQKCGQAVGEEARALFNRNKGGGLCRWAPTIDMERDPRWGRTEEAYGEDPYLTGEMASSYIRGMQGEDPFYLQCGATLKHFYANNVEKDRIKISSSLDGRNKYEYYLEPFRKAISEGKAEAVMTSYNEINGIPAIVNEEVQKILKDTYGLPGHVVCDGGDMQQTVQDHQYFETHAETIAYGLKAGIDCFTDDKDVVIEAARQAYDKGWITEEEIDRSVRNSFRTRIRLGLYDSKGDCPYTGMREAFVNNEAHQSVCVQMAAASVVLLKNDQNLLPLLPEKTDSIAVVGPLADVWYKDWYCGIAPYTVSVLDGIKEAYPAADIAFQSGLSQIYLTCDGKYVGLDEHTRLKLTDQEHAEVFTYTDWGFGSSTLTAKSSGLFVTLEEDSCSVRADKKEAFGWFIRESFHFTQLLDGTYHIISWNEGSIAIDEKGYLTCTACDQPEEKTQAAAAFGMEMIEDGIKKAVEAAGKASNAVVVIGNNPVINSKEEIDRTTIALPPFQQKLADSILAANKRTIIVLVSNYPYAVNKLKEEAPGILLCASGSQEQGTGVAAILSGKQSPAGRLPMTWYCSDQDLPDMNDYDIIKGRRTYQYFDREVLFPFGYGLSYSTFDYREMSTELSENDVKVKVTVRNTGSRTADEVVQLYVHKEESRVKQPIKQLKGFVRLKGIAPGETREAKFRVAKKELRYYDVISQAMLLEEGNYCFMAGASSQDIRQRETVFLKGNKAGSRNPFETTAAERYDSYEHCFIHKGVNGNTCIIPGKAGDPPDTADDQTEGDRPGCKQECELIYRDVVFVRSPEELHFQVWGLEPSQIQASLLTRESNAAKAEIAVKVNPGTGFEELKCRIPADFTAGDENYTLRIRITGKCKLSTFCFR